MDKQEYLNAKAKQIKEIFDSYQFNTFFNQIYAKKYGAQFNETYNENSLWSGALFLSSKGALLLQSEANKELGLKALRVSAEVYENLYYISKEYDREFALILSALSYDISGYQANAKCLIKILTQPYELNNDSEDDLDQYNIETLNLENIFLKVIQSFLSKKIILTRKLCQQGMSESSDATFFTEAFQKFFFGMKECCDCILYGKEVDYIFYLQNAFDMFLSNGHVLLSQITHLLIIRLALIDERGVWSNLRRQGKLNNQSWETFIRLLTINAYGSFSLVNDEQRESIFEFWRSQLAAIEKGLLNSESSFVVQMPTSAGKTFIAELAVLDSLTNYPDKRCLYIAPFRALTFEIEENLSNRLSKLGYIVSGVAGSYEVDESQDFWIKEANVLVATPEKIDLLLRLKPEYFQEISLVIIDEGHVIGKTDTRSALFELLISRLKRKSYDSKFLFISAVMPEVNTKDFCLWLCNNEESNIYSPNDYDNQKWQPTRRLIGKFTWNNNRGRIEFEGRKISGSFKIPNTFIPGLIEVKKYSFINPVSGRINNRSFPDNRNKSQTTAELAVKYSEDGPVMIFCSKPGSNGGCESVGNALLTLIDLLEADGSKTVPDKFKAKENLESIAVAENWLGEESIITKCLKRGIGIHYGPLAEPVRKSIEKDYRAGKLSILISTNTLGQGVNFPIKTIIIHSVTINAQEKVYVEIRDFWNIVGRAGRAGKETEGQIIFLVLSDTDQALYNEYVQGSNIEPVESVLYKLLKIYLENRMKLITRLKRGVLKELVLGQHIQLQQAFSEALISLIEPSLLNLLVEESLENESQINNDFISELLSTSLFKIQAIDMNINPIIKETKKIAKNFFNRVQTSETRSLYAKTGFCLESCIKINEYIEENLSDLITSYDDTINEFLKKIIDCLLDIKEMRCEKFDGDLLIQYSNDLKSFILNWIDGKDAKNLRKIWLESFCETPLEEKMNLFIEEYLFYRYPWGITAFLTILTHHFNISFEDFSTRTKNLPSFVKYGLNNEVSCWGKSVGIYTREAATALASFYLRNNEEQDFVQFIKWFANLSFEDIKINLSELSEFERQNINNLSLKIITKNNTNTGSVKGIKCYVKGIAYETERKTTSKMVKVNDLLELKRDYDNPHDSYAIKIYWNQIELGFVPREFARRLAIRIDLFQDEYYGLVIKKLRAGDYSRIIVHILPQNHS